MKKLVSAVLVVTCGSLLNVLPVFAGDGPSTPAEPGAPAPAPAPATVSAGEKNPLVPGLMSAILPCTGQWYNGQLLEWKTGAMAAIEAGSIFVLVFFLAEGPQGVAFAGMGGMIANHAWSGWDAWNTAKKQNQGLALQMDKNRTMVSYNVPF